MSSFVIVPPGDRDRIGMSGAVEECLSANQKLERMSIA
jgi:hypothetical protein